MIIQQQQESYDAMQFGYPTTHVSVPSLPPEEFAAVDALKATLSNSCKIKSINQSDATTES